MKILLSQDLSKCRIDKSGFPKITYLKKHFLVVSDIILDHFKLSGLLKKATISVLLAGDKYIQQVNLGTRGKNKPTNVLSFPYMEFRHASGSVTMNEGEDHWNILGDIVFGMETCAIEAQSQGKTLDNHLTHLFIHSLLHLLGFDHIKKSEARQMEKIEIKLLKKLGIKNPYRIGTFHN